MKSSLIGKAIRAINPSAKFTVHGDNTDTIDWLKDTTPISASDIETKVNYPIPLHLQPAAKDSGYKKGDYPVAEKLADTILSLPLYPELRDDQVYYVIEKISQFCKN